MAVIKHADTSVVRVDAPLRPDTRVSELLDTDKNVTWLKIGRYRIGLNENECDQVEKHFKLMRAMRKAGDQ
jgi:hypothetical protein